MKLYWWPKTRAARAVWLLEEAGVPYERVAINIRDETARSDPAFRGASPMGKVAALEDGGRSDLGFGCDLRVHRGPVPRSPPRTPRSVIRNAAII